MTVLDTNAVAFFFFIIQPHIQENENGAMVQDRHDSWIQLNPTATQCPGLFRGDDCWPFLSHRNTEHLRARESSRKAIDVAETSHYENL